MMFWKKFCKINSIDGFSEKPIDFSLAKTYDAEGAFAEKLNFPKPCRWFYGRPPRWRKKFIATACQVGFQESLKKHTKYESDLIAACDREKSKGMFDWNRHLNAKGFTQIPFIGNETVVTVINGAARELE